MKLVTIPTFMMPLFYDSGHNSMEFAQTYSVGQFWSKTHEKHKPVIPNLRSIIREPFFYRIKGLVSLGHFIEKGGWAIRKCPNYEPIYNRF